MTEIRSHLDGCEVCSGRLAAQENHRAEFELMPIPEALRAPPPRRRWWLGIALPLLVGAAAAALLVPRLMAEPDSLLGVSPPAHTTKGAQGDAPVLARQTVDGTAGIRAWLGADSPRLITDADVLRPGDRVQISYRTLSRSRVTLAGRDGAGVVEVYGSLDAEAGGDWHLAPISLVLDQTPGDQILFTVYSDEPLDQSTLREALGRDRPLPDTEVVGLLLPKVVD